LSRGIGIIILCLACGYLMRISFFKRIRNWMDQRLTMYIPGYKSYRDTAITQLEGKEEALPYKNAALATVNGMQQPCFVMETLSDGRYVVFFPVAGNVTQGIVSLLVAENVQVLQRVDMRSYSEAINKLGLGIGK
jgi:uncharacterized membrane protein